METIINTKELRTTLPKIVDSVRRGEQFTVLYRSRPAFRIVPINEIDHPTTPLETEFKVQDCRCLSVEGLYTPDTEKRRSLRRVRSVRL